MPASSAATARPAEQRAALPRVGLGVVSGALVAACFAQAPGRLVADTKLDLVVDPVTFLARALHMWDPVARFGYVPNQEVGYLFPMGPFFAAGYELGVPMWLVQRAWWAVLLLAALWGTVLLVRALRVGTPATWLIAGSAYALSPWFVGQLGAISAALLPAAAAPWVLLPLVRGSDGGSPRRAAALSALAVVFAGGVNGSATLGILVLPVLWLATRAPSPRRRQLAGWWSLSAALAVAWWLVPLALQARYGFDFLPYTESVEAITAATSVPETLRGTSYWLMYLNLDQPWLDAGWMVVSWPVVILASAVLAAGGLAGLTRRGLPERRFLVFVLAAGMVLVAAAYHGPLAGLAGSLIRRALNEPPVMAFKNVHKFEPLVLLPLAVGLAHLAGGQWTPTVRRVLGGALVAAVVVTAAPLLTRRVPVGSYPGVPAYWRQVASFLNEAAGDSRVLVLPAADHALFRWGQALEEPLQPLSRVPWAEQDLVPLSGVGPYQLLHAVEQRIRDGVPHGGLPHFLARAGVRYVVVRNDLDWRRAGAPRPLHVTQALLDSGLQRVLSVGPRLDELGPAPAGGTIGELEAGLSAVEVFEVDEPVSLVTTYPRETAVRVSGGVGSLLQLADRTLLRDRAALLAADRPAGGEPVAFTDAYRRRHATFGTVYDNLSYTLTARGDPPQDRGPFRSLSLNPDGSHQAVARLAGVDAVTASSYGSWLTELPGLQPFHAVDDDPETAWVTANAFGSTGQWLQVDLEEALAPSHLTVRLLQEGPWRPTVTRLRVTTEAGSVVTDVDGGEQPQTVEVAPGSTRWIRVSFEEVTNEQVGFAGAGIREVDIPGVDAQRFVEVPDAPVEGAARLYAFDRAAVSPYSLLGRSEETRIARRFVLDEPVRLIPRGAVVPRRGQALDALLSGGRPLRATSRSTWGSLPRFRAANLVDGDPTSIWLAQPSQPPPQPGALPGSAAPPDSPPPRVRLRWPGTRTLSRLRVVAAPDDTATTPVRIRLSSPDGQRTLTVRPGRMVGFRPLVTDRVTLSFAAPPEGNGQRSPLGLGELEVPALADLYVPFDTQQTFRLPCGRGPALVVDGAAHPTAVHGVFEDLVALRPLSLEVCDRRGRTGGGGLLELDSGPHTVEMDPIPGLAPSTLTLASPDFETVPARSEERPVTVTRWDAERRELTVGPGGRAYLAVREAVNDGWRATLEGRSLTPVTVDGWQQGFELPAGSGGTVELVYAPGGAYRLALLLGAVAVGVVAALAAAPTRREAPVPTGPRRSPGGTALLVGAGVVVLLLSAPLVVVVVPLALLARFRPGLLPAVTAAAMVAAGVAVAVQPGSAPGGGQGAFGAVAQGTAVTAVAGVLVAAALEPWRDGRAGADEPNRPSAGPRRWLAGLWSGSRR